MRERSRRRTIFFVVLFVCAPWLLQVSDSRRARRAIAALCGIFVLVMWLTAMLDGLNATGFALTVYFGGVGIALAIWEQSLAAADEEERARRQRRVDRYRAQARRQSPV